MCWVHWILQSRLPPRTLTRPHTLYHKPQDDIEAELDDDIEDPDEVMFGADVSTTDCGDRLN